MAFLAWIVVGLIAVSLPAIIVAFIGAVILVGSTRLIKKAYSEATNACFT
jgi:hypothetical protein